MLNKIILSVSIVLLLGLYYLDLIPMDIDEGFIGRVLLILGFCIISFFWVRNERQREIKSQYVRMSVIFVISFSIVHFQAYVDYIFGFLDSDNYFVWIDRSVVNKSVVISSIAIISYFLGYSLRGVNTSSTTSKGVQQTIVVVNYRILEYLSLLFFLYFLINIDSSFLQSSNYGDRSIESKGGYGPLFFESSVFAIIVLNIRNLLVLKQTNITILKYIKSYGFIFYVLILYLGLVMMSGDRGPLIYLILGFVFGYIFVTSRKFSLPTIVFSIAVLATFITLLGVIRGLNEEGTFTDKITQAITNPDLKKSRVYPSSIINNTKELAASVRTVHLAVANVPGKYDYFFGLFLAQNVSVIFPGFNSLMNEFFSIPRPLFTSARFFTFLDMGLFPSYGVGTSCVADVFIDFGVIGTVIIFGFFGLFTRRMELIALVKIKPSILAVATALLFFSFSVYISRSNLIIPFTKLTYVVALCYVPSLFKRK